MDQAFSKSEQFCEDMWFDQESLFVLRCGLEKFCALQRERLEGVGSIRVLRSVYSEDLFKIASRVMDRCAFHVPLFWNLFGRVVRVGEAGIDSTNVRDELLSWHREFFLDDDHLEQLEVKLATRNIDVDTIGRVVRGAMQLFFAGDMSGAASVMSRLMDVVQVTHQFTNDERACLTDVLNLIVEGDQAGGDALTREMWQAEASALLTDAREVLNAEVSPSSSALGDMLRSAMLDMLVMMSRDEHHVQQTVKNLELDFVWYVAAIVSLNFDSLTLPELSVIASGARGEFRDRWEWTDDVMCKFFACTNLTDLVAPLRDLWNRAVDTRDTSTTFLVSRFMVAHLVDLCTPCIPSNKEQMMLLFERNSMLADYASTFQHLPGLWQTAARYLLFTPLGDPQRLFECLENGVIEVAQDVTGRAFDRVESFLMHHLDHESLFQCSIRTFVKENVQLDSSSRVFAAVDELTRDLRRRLCRAQFNLLSKRRSLVSAVTFGAKYRDLHSDVVQQLRNLVESSTVLQDRDVLQLGHAVNSGLVVLPADNAKLCQLLVLVAHLSDVVEHVEAKAGALGTRLLKAVVDALQTDDGEHLQDSVKLRLIRAAIRVDLGKDTDALLQLSQFLSGLGDCAERTMLIAAAVTLLGSPGADIVF